MIVLGEFFNTIDPNLVKDKVTQVEFVAFTITVSTNSYFQKLLLYSVFFSDLVFSALIIVFLFLTFLKGLLTLRKALLSTVTVALGLGTNPGVLLHIS